MNQQQLAEYWGISTNYGFEYCLVNGELRLWPKKLPLDLALKLASE